MNGDLKPKNKRTITVEDLDSGAVRITAVGPPYLVATGAPAIRTVGILSGLSL